MFYFGRIISAFFNQLFRFLLWNKFGQKLLIIIIISLIAFWCVGMTKVHAVEEVEDINYRVQSYYDGVVGEFIQRLMRLYNDGSIGKGAIDTFVAQNIYLYYGNENGSSYNNAQPITNRYLYVARWSKQVNVLSSFQPSIYDYLGVTGYSMYLTNSNQISRQVLDGSRSLSSSTANVDIYIPNFISTYQSPLWSDFCFYWVTDNSSAIAGLLEDIKEEQQATNEFLNEEADTDNIVIDTPSVSDEASDNMSNNLHNQINTLTTNLQNTVNNYYEGWNAYTWSIPLPDYIGGNITFDSGVTRRIIGTSGVVYNIIQAIWVVLFGGYIVGFIKRMLDWVQTGKIFDEGGIADFIWWMDTNNEIIKASMM